MNKPDEVVKALQEWVKDTTVYLDFNTARQTSEYNTGFAEGIEMAMTSLKAYLKDHAGVDLERRKSN